MSKVSDKILLRVYLLMAAVGIFAVLIVVRIGILQFVQRDKWVGLAEEDRKYYKKIPAARGDILSDDLHVLATSQPFFRVAIDPSRVDKDAFANFEASLDSLCKLLEAKFGDEEFNTDYFRNRIANAIEHRHQHLYLVSGKVDFQVCKEMKVWPILRNHRNKGGLIEEKLLNTRFYPFADMGKITLGSLRDDSVAVRGLEYSFDGELRGRDGNRLMHRFAGNLEVPVQDFGENEAQDGHDIVTTINVEMQDVVEAAVRRGVERHGAKYGVGILMEVKTGHIKAIANYPENYNYAAATLMEPGSTFKLASVIAVLEDGHVQLADSITIDNGRYNFYDKVMEDHADHGEKVSFAEGFEFSSNVAISRVITERYGDHPDRFIAHLERMGLVKPVMSQKQLEGEPSPEITRPGNRRMWSGTTLPWMSIGYNVRLTPLQVLTFYNAIANKGKMIEPLLVKEIRKNNVVVKEFKAAVLNPSVCSKSTLLQVQRLLEGVVQRGTAGGIKSADYRIAGKTGTAQLLVGRQYVERYRASFAGYFPADDPKYSLLVLIEDPTVAGYYGSSVAAPIFKEISDQVYAMDIEISRLALPAGSGKALTPAKVLIDKTNALAYYKEFNFSAGKEPESRWVTPGTANGRENPLSEVRVGSGLVPDTRGMSARDAICLLESLGLKVTLVGSGRVADQSIPRGTVLEKGKSITLSLE